MVSSAADARRCEPVFVPLPVADPDADDRLGVASPERMLAGVTAGARTVGAVPLMCPSLGSAALWLWAGRTGPGDPAGSSGDWLDMETLS